MIKVKHPKESYNKQQADLIAKCPNSMKRFHELAFSYGNAAYRYHFRALEFNPTEEDFALWLEGLPPNIAKDMSARGFEACRSSLPFTRFVNELNDVGMEKYIRSLMGDDLYDEYQKII